MRLTQSPVRVVLGGRDTKYWQRFHEALSDVDEYAIPEAISDIPSIPKLLKHELAPILLFLAHPDENTTWKIIRDLESRFCNSNFFTAVCISKPGDRDVEVAFNQGANIVVTVSGCDSQLKNSLSEVLFHIRQLNTWNFQKDTFFLMR